MFATRKRFPDADEVVVDWPHRWLASQEVDARTVICVLTHDPKFDVPALTEAVTTRAAYIGAMGSRRTHEDRLVRLKEAGLTDEEVARIHSPIGLDLGARTPEETAISIAAEIVQARWGGSGRRLRRSPTARSTPAPRGDAVTRTAGLVLAAGEGRRFGGPKAPYVLDGERLVDRAVRVLREAGCDPVVVVLGAWVGEVPGAEVVGNEDVGRGHGLVAARGARRARTP